MIEEALAFMTEQGKKLADPVVRVSGEPGHVYFLRQTDGSLKRYEAAAAPRSHKAASIEAIVNKAADAIKEGDMPEIWYSRAGVAIYLDASDRRDTVQLNLGLSLPLSRLIELEKQRPGFQQAQLIKELRITFRDCLTSAGNLVEVLRKVKFNAGKDVDSEVQHGKVSLGKTLTAQVTGTGVLPEYVTLTVPVFANRTLASCTATVECALEPDAGTETFQLIPLPGQIERAIDAGETKLGSMIHQGLAEAKAEATGVFFGQP